MPIVNFNNITDGLNANARQHSHYIVNADPGDAGIWVTKPVAHLFQDSAITLAKSAQETAQLTGESTCVQ